MRNQVYRVVVTREDDNWLADLPELVGAHTFARTLRALDKMVREVVVLAADLPDDAMGGLDFDWEFHTGDLALDREAAEIRALRSRAEELRAKATRCTDVLAQKLVAHGTSVRDAAVLLGVSPQRVSQVAGQARRSA